MFVKFQWKNSKVCSHDGCLHGSFFGKRGRRSTINAHGDKKSFKRILTLLENMKETPYHGIGKPEALKYELSGLYSRRIDSKNRLVYKVDESEKKTTVYQVKDHY